ncbi:hypothetical protein A3D66_01105 [Candidatus Kaiserbacteria bacterium RIFCSPHIGHO2_02_FULL_50_9]|uniref:GH15-like domain-containing protein n=1 Tax=Candidatus Kaiserbacteria bacterium RIFCSPLOWO2_01_FULL_51_21 TaxID=1798508 RepID=A0A1F6EF17_9BACT|nr:MAG: hypothetical protein A2761_01650 [Candidatus Kaiserbacteria bacterium RIFCSPHIGHO2_01_FULL_51_33]OGG63496.1 MAG: hypothetical protein A3D66_01105 [Candidatus Kaiserbacteria bacterium RIFCSPHIGHO2_02_FULL_50_9]OGG71812.1 MAG: hypothetical protein A3A35_02735 [Candidatus Kaiserbacteria bacterium RIFCSPLOWO2_01_FULL_51_21]
MPRAVTLGNGHILVGLDARAQVRDFYFPYVGLENHLGVGQVHRVGVFADGQLRWFSDPSWDIRIEYDKETAAGKVVATNTTLGIACTSTDVVYNEKNILVREFTLENLREGTRDIKVFFSHQFELSQAHGGDTVYFDPRCEAIIHYKGRRVFLINARHNKTNFDDYSVGLFEVEGREGTHTDAADGVLAKNPIEHGTVDSVIGVSLSLAHEPKIVEYWVAVGESIAEVHALNAYVLEKTPAHLTRTTRDFWRAWVNRQNFSFYGLSEGVIAQFKRSLFIIRTHADNNGSIIASSDSDMLQHGRDSYAYMWPRDGAFAAMALDRAGDFGVARKFFEFCGDVAAGKGYFMHKYRPDQSLGSSWEAWLREGKPELPIQEDESSIVLFALWKHYRLTKDIEFIESIYGSLIKSVADFLLTYEETALGLPHPSYDLWEQKYGITTYTMSARYGALMAAANFANLLGKEDAARTYNKGALAIKEMILKYLYDAKSGIFLKLIQVAGDKKILADTTLDMSSFFGLFHFGVLLPEDPRLAKFSEVLRGHLFLKEGIRGVPRFSYDEYYRVEGVRESNPWFITTLWFAQYLTLTAKGEKDFVEIKEWLEWVVAHALPSGVLSEQLNPWSGEQISAAPLVWSHAEFVHTVINYLEKLETMGLCIACNPVNNV